MAEHGKNVIPLAEWHRYSLFTFSPLAPIGVSAQLCTSTTYLTLDEMAKWAHHCKNYILGVQYACIVYVHV
jgi:hypothetical protein